MRFWFHERITRDACVDLIEDASIADIIVKSNMMQDGYPALRDYFPRVYRVFDTIYKQFFRHEYHYTRFLWQKHEYAAINAENYLNYMWEKSIDETILLSTRAIYLGKNLHVRQDKFSHESQGKVVSFSPLDVLGIGYCHSKYAIDEPDKYLLNEVILVTKEVIQEWVSHYM